MLTEPRHSPDRDGIAVEHCDVLVVGGGPAGSTIAALLAERGRRVVLVEKDRQPRFHIGESLLPLNLPLFERLGIKNAVERVGMVKYGVEFVSAAHQRAVRYEFARAWDKTFPYAYHVRRSEFDHLLLRNAAAKGAEIVEEFRVTEVDFLPEGGALVKGRGTDGGERRWRAAFLADASGRDTLLAAKLGLKRRNRKHASAAVYGHFTDAERLPGKAEGDISIFWFEHGWFWFIPLVDGTTSVGAVCRPEFIKARKGDVTTFFMSTIASCPELAARLRQARLVSPAAATGNYSYSATRMFGRSFILLGDAFAFIDPVFSTGVYIAMTMAFLGADAVEACLCDPRKAGRALRHFEAETLRGLKSLSWYIYRINSPAIRDMFMSPRNFLRVEEAMLSLLAGDVFRPSPIRKRLLVFKAFYYMVSLLNMRACIKGWWLRRRKAAFAIID